MGKLGGVVDRQKESIKGIIKRYLLTIICANIACVLGIVLDATDLYNKSSVRDMFDYIFGFLITFAIGSFFVETVFTEDGSNRKKLILPYVIFGLISLVLDIFGNNADTFSEMGEDMFFKIFYLYIILCIALGFHRLIKNSGMSFEKYAVNLLVGVIKVGIVLLLLNVGFILLVTIFDKLIVDIDEWEFIEYVEIFLIGAVYLPYSLICVTDKTETNSKFIKGLLLQILMPMVSAAMIIIYMYVLIILVTRHMPRNEVFGICANLFCYGVVIWTLAYSFAPDAYKDKNTKGAAIYRNVIKYAKYIYAPFILLEWYSIGIRIREYGVTLDRYFAVVFIVCQIIYIAWEPLYGLVRKMFKKEKNGYAEGYEHLLFVGIAVYVLCVLLPFFSGEKIEFLSQKKRFEALMDVYYAEELTMFDDETKSARSAYRVIESNIYGRKYLEETYTEAERKALENEFYGASYTRQWDYYAKETDDAISVYGYNYMYQFTGYSAYDVYQYIGADDTEPLNISIYYLENTGDKLVCDVDMKELVKLIISRGKDIDNDRRARDDGTLPYVIRTDDGRKCVITRITFNYESSEDLIEIRDLKGYILW